MDSQAKLVQDSPDVIGDRANGVATLFYMRLFELDTGCLGKALRRYG